jgi:hypothetical protein
VVVVAIAAALPGGGHYYAGEEGRAVAIASALTAGTLLVWSAWGAADNCRTPECDAAAIQRRSNIGFGMVAGVYLFSLVDAPFAAARQNRKRSAAFPAPAVNLIVSAGGAFGVGVRVPLVH